MKLWTIGYAGRTAEEFFDLLDYQEEIDKVVDVRLRPHSQLNGFCRGKDLPYFLHNLASKGYEWRPTLAPSRELLKQYRDGQLGDGLVGWDEYARRYVDDLKAVDMAQAIDPEHLAGGCLLCSEREPHQCHRRLAAEYLRDAWRDLHGVETEIIHL